MALISPPIAVAAATAVLFSFRQYHAGVNVQVRFYTDAAGLVEVGTRGTGSRNIVATNTASGYEGLFSSPTPLASFESDIDGGSLAGAVDGKWYELLLGGGMQNVTLAATQVVDPAGSATYRIIVDSPGDSVLA